MRHVCRCLYRPFIEENHLFLVQSDLFGQLTRFAASFGKYIPIEENEIYINVRPTHWVGLTGSLFM
jgi:hypothetical protein